MKKADSPRKVPRQKMPEQAPEKRRKNFEEVALGFSPEMAVMEASRCLECKKPLCVEGCPVGVPIPEFINLIKNKDFSGAVRKIRAKNALPAICGRVCPQENQCEGKCILGKKGESVSIGALERFLADFERLSGNVELPKKDKSTGNRIAVVGSGPAGLTVAGDLSVKGHDVTMFEAFHKTGGVLVYGIPEFRLPKSIVEAEVGLLEKLGVKIECNTVIGLTSSIDELFEEGFDAVFVAVGAGLPKFMEIPGENLVGVCSANEYLTRTNLMKAYDPNYDTPAPSGKNVVVLGAGNVAMDAARTAMRLGAESVKIVYRRSMAEMPARKEEIHHAEQEGIEFVLLTAPSKFVGNKDGFLSGMECIKMELSEPDESGRRKPVPVKNSEYIIDCDLAVIAVGSGANPILARKEPGIALSKYGYIIADQLTGKTSKRAVWAGGDIVTGQATVIEAMGAGRRAADSIDEYLCGGEF